MQLLKYTQLLNQAFVLSMGRFLISGQRDFATREYELQNAISMTNRIGRNDKIDSTKDQNRIEKTE